MKATFDVTVKIDGRNIGVSLAMHDGAKDIRQSGGFVRLKIVT